MSAKKNLSSYYVLFNNTFRRIPKSFSWKLYWTIWRKNITSWNRIFDDYL